MSASPPPPPLKNSTTHQLSTALRKAGAPEAMIDFCVTLVEAGRAAFEREGDRTLFRMIDGGRLFVIVPGGLQRIE